MISDKCSELFHNAFVELDKLIEKVQFEENLTLELTLGNYDLNLFNTLPRCPGIYFFSMKIPIIHQAYSLLDNNIQNFSQVWKEYDGKSIIWTPGLKIKRCLYHLNENRDQDFYREGWIPLYLGKSENIQNRVRQHFEQNPMQHTFGMKLGARKNMEGISIKIQLIPFNFSNSKTILPYIETKIRNRLNPIIGQ